jgi:hypothetical protein
MAVVRGDRIAESKKLNLCSFAAHVAYGTFVGCVPDDFGRFRASPTAIAERMFPRREADRRRIETAIRAWLAEWSKDNGEGPLIKLWSVDGVQWGEMTGWRATGNLQHRTPEPPWSEHQHDGRCATTALARAREWGSSGEVESLSFLIKKIRGQNSNRARAGFKAEPEPSLSPLSPLSSSSPSSPSSNGENGRDGRDGRGATEESSGDVPRPSRSVGRDREPVTETTAAEVDMLAEELAGICADVPAEEWVARASRIEADSRRPAKSFRRPREPGVSEPWAQTTVRKLTEFVEQARRPLPL